MEGVIPAKRALRAEMRRIRRSLTDQEERSARIWRAVRELPAVRRASVVMVFSSVPGEPHTTPFMDWCRSQGKEVVLPEDDVDPRTIDVVVVPGIAFSPDGHRLGQGGGWYDRFLPQTRDDCVTVGVGYEVQVVDALPVEAHDVVLDHVVTDAGVVR